LKIKNGGEKMPRVIGNDGVRFIVIDDGDTIKKAIEKIREEKKFRKREKKIRREKTK
jgi:hypothetical protein